MARYLKYLEIVNKIDSALEKKVAGKVDIDKDLPKIKTMLEVQKLALEMSMCVDRIDDNVKSSFKLYAKGDPSARGVVEEVLEKVGMSGDKEKSGMGGESASGRDFRRGRENPEPDRRHSTRAWPPAGRSDARGEMNMHEEDRRGRSRRYRAESDDWNDDEDWMLFDHLNEEDRRGRSARTGRYVHRAEAEQNPQAFWPLAPYPFLPFGMFGPGNENGRMGFTGNGRTDHAPYNGPLTKPLQDLPIVGQQANKTNDPAMANTATGGHPVTK